MTIEIWKDIVGYEGYYQVSNLGNVRSLDRLVKHPKGGDKLVNGKILKSKSYDEKKSYPSVMLNKNGERKTFNVHRLVARAFPEVCGEWFDGCCVDHIDTNHGNNNCKNLRICTHHENNMNPITRKKYHDMQVGKKKNFTIWNKGIKLPQLSGENSGRSRAILQFDMCGNFIAEWVNTTSAAESIGIARTSITNCLVGRSKNAFGCLWKYKEV